MGSTMVPIEPVVVFSRHNDLMTCQERPGLKIESDDSSDEEMARYRLAHVLNNSCIYVEARFLRI